MKSAIFDRVVNIGLRSLSMGSRFILIFSLAKLLSPTELGLFGLMMATVSFSMLIIGADYYTYSQRELLARPIEQWSFVIQHQMKAQVILYVVLLPAHFIIFFLGLIEWEYAVWFFLLLILEHISQEINRLLVAMHRQILASWVLFMRTGSWVLFVIPLMFFYEEYQNLLTLYIAWSVGGALAIFVGVGAVRAALPIWDKVPIDYGWLKKGFKVGGFFLIATICFKGLLTFDKYAVEAFSSIEILGVYVFYIGIVMGLYNLLDPAVFSFLYPKMLQSYQMKEKNKFNKIFKELIISTLIISTLLAIVIWTLIPYIIKWVGKPIYENYLDSLTFLLAAGFAYAVGYIPHYALYAMKGDKWIITAHITALMVFFVSLAFIQLENGIQTVALGLFLSFSWMVLLKTVGYQVVKKNAVLFKGG